MDETNPEHLQRVVKFVQEMLQDEQDKSEISPALINEKISLVLTIQPKWAIGLDREAAVDELIRRFSVWIGQDATIKSDDDHEAWLTASRRKDWRYWQRYREWLERKLSLSAVDALDDSTNRVLGLLEDPHREGPWSRRGLVVGHVQSGKTSNYTALISKAADAGYKIIIVLAGLHNNLRSQTQMRLDEGFLGYETKPVMDDIRLIGVGEIDGDPAIRPNFATNRTEKGDFNSSVSKNLGISPEQRPWLFVVKKNKSVLESLLKWIRQHVANAQDSETGRRIVTHLPLLLVDDEADHASVDTGAQVFDGEGQPDKEHDPTAINSRIRQILHSFSRSAYVGYTATPFANIFIHERGSTTDEGPDLFPSAFIINLAAPSNYVGPARVFGCGSQMGREGGLPLIRDVTDHAGVKDRKDWMPQGHKSSFRPPALTPHGIPDSLVEAIDAFVLSCAIRKLRGQGRQHNSMLVHVTRFNAVQEHVKDAVAAHVGHMAQRMRIGIGNESLLKRLRELWLADLVPTSEEVGGQSDVDNGSCELPSWEDVVAVLHEVLEDIQVRMINGTAKDALDYVDHEATGLKVIAIGGDKLARGLTLEGLCVSYFLRASRMYDTLMQMGRWFGYRPGYLDLCRLYTTEDLTTWFEHITDAAEELREEFEIMARSGATPREYGLRVQSHPVLMVTSRLKMRAARSLMLSFSGQLRETVTFYADSPRLNKNLEAVRSLLVALGKPEENPKQVRFEQTSEWKGFLWRNATGPQVIDFLSTYQTHPGATKVNSTLMAQFIQEMQRDGELTEWTVAVIGSKAAKGHQHFELLPGITATMIERKLTSSDATSYSIGRLLSPRDESIDADAATWKAALEVTQDAWRKDPGRQQKVEFPDSPSGVALRRVRGLGSDGVPPHPERGLLLIYLIDPTYGSDEMASPLPEGAPPLVAIGVSFPGSNSGRKVEYKVNNVLWETEYGPED